MKIERFNDVITHANQYVNGGGELMAPSAFGPELDDSSVGLFLLCVFVFLIKLLVFLTFAGFVLFHIRRESQPTRQQVRSEDQSCKSSLRAH